MEDGNRGICNNAFVLSASKQHSSLGMCLGSTAMCTSCCIYLLLVLMRAILITNKSTDPSSWLQLEQKPPASSHFWKVRIASITEESRTGLIGGETACLLQECGCYFLVSREFLQFANQNQTKSTNQISSRAILDFLRL